MSRKMMFRKILMLAAIAIGSFVLSNQASAEGFFSSFRKHRTPTAAKQTQQPRRFLFPGRSTPPTNVSAYDFKARYSRSSYDRPYYGIGTSVRPGAGYFFRISD